MGDARMKLCISYNCVSEVEAHITDCESAIDMWELLQKEYEGSGTVLNYQAIQAYVTIKYDHYDSLDAFILAFKKSIKRLRVLKLEPLKEWHPLMFIALVNYKFPT